MLRSKIRALSSIVFFLASFVPAASIAGTEPAGPLATARTNHLLVPLADGRALVAGGFLPSSASATASAEVYNASTATFATTAPMSIARADAAGARLADGRVLVAGGTPVNQSPPADVATAELYDPVSGTWSATGSMSAARRSALAVALPSGLVLVIAGDTTSRACELYDPATGTFTPTGSLAVGRIRFVASALPDGRVLVAGGQAGVGGASISSAEVWDPVTGTFSPTGSMASGRAGATATALADGRVLVVAGLAGTSTSTGLASAEIFDPVTGLFSNTGALATARNGHVAAQMGDGNVVIAGGTSASFVMTPSIERYDVAAGTWRSAGVMSIGRTSFSAGTLADGDVLLASGYTVNGSTTTAEIVDAACIAAVPSISPAGLNAPTSGSTGSVSITHTAGCTWRAINSSSWFTFTSATQGVGSGTIAYSVAENTSSFGRGVTPTIADNAFAVNQAGNPCAGASLSPASQSFSYPGGTNSASLSVGGSCSWTVAGAPSWITITSAGTGSASISYTVAANTGTQRTATLTIAGRTLSVTQSANPCSPAPTISPASRSFTVGGGSSTVAVTAPSSCSWVVTNKPAWVTMSTSGFGTTTLSVTAAANPGAERSATFTVAGNDFSVTQAANACADAALSPASASLANGSGTGSITLTAQAACAWNVTGTPSWMTITSATSGTGNATIGYTYTANSAGARSGTLSIAGKSFPVSQAAAVCFPAPTISPSSIAFTATGGATGTGTVNVTAPTGCPWSVSSSPPWIAVTGGSSGSGNGVVTYSIAPNIDPVARNTSLLIANVSHSVSQSAAGLATLPTGRLAMARRSHSATALADGRVLIAGGYLATGAQSLSSSVEIYDPATGAFTPAASMVNTRGEHAAVRLADGRVLVVGGTGYLNGTTYSWSNGEIYDPATDSWSLTSSTSVPRSTAVAVLLADGRVMVDTMTNGGVSEIFDPATGTFTTTGSRSVARLGAALTALADGRVLVLGGTNSSGTTHLASGELWNPATGTWSPTSPMAFARSNGPSANLLADGRVLVSGGYGGSGPIAASELFDPATGAFTLTGSAVLPRDSHQSSVLADGSVVIIGGVGANNTVERYDVAAGTWRTVGQFSDSRSYYTAALAGNGKVLAAGGFPGPGSSAEAFDPAVCATPATLGSSSQSFTSAAGSGSVAVTLAAACPRSVSSDRPLWVSVTSSGSGSGTLTYTVSANTSSTPRAATFSIAGAAYTVTQAGATLPPPSYCASRGTTSSYEWIQSVTVAGQLRTTGNNGGYGDFSTSTATIPLARGSNALSVTAGGGYGETWRIWIDFNNDMQFTADEVVYSGAGSGTLNSSFTVPTTVAAGTRRMRISMAYGGAPPGCGTFSYGEVEDYTVTIP